MKNFKIWILFFFAAETFLSCGKSPKVVVIDLYPYGGDTVINYPNTTTNYGGDKEINIYCDSVEKNIYINRGLFQFPLEKAYKMEIDSVILQLYFNENSGFYASKERGHSGNTTLIFEKIEEPWTENSIDWKNYPKVSSEKVVFEGTLKKFQDLKINVTKLYPKSGRYLNTHHGLVIRLKNEEIGNYVHIVSKENSDKRSTPKLKIYGKE